MLFAFVLGDSRGMYSAEYGSILRVLAWKRLRTRSSVFNNESSTGEVSFSGLVDLLTTGIVVIVFAGTMVLSDDGFSTLTRGGRDALLVGAEL